MKYNYEQKMHKYSKYDHDPFVVVKKDSFMQ